MISFQVAASQSIRDWPSARFESLWQEVVAAAPTGSFTKQQVAGMPVITQPEWGNIPVGAWVQVTGKLEQRTPMGSMHPDGEEWFVRPSSGDPIAVYAMTLSQYPVGSMVSIIGRDAGTIRLADRQGTLREYPALIGRPIERGATREMQADSQVASGGFSTGLIAIFAVIVLIGAWLGVRSMAKRSSALGASRIRAVADRARERDISTKESLDAAAGATGAQGIQGATGATGAQGVTGAAGTNGTNGQEDDIERWRRLD